MSTQPADTADFRFHIQHELEAPLQVVRFRGKEGIGQPYELQIELVSELDDLPLDDFLGKQATLVLRGKSGPRRFHGIIDRFEQLSVGTRHSTYAALLVPTISVLHHTLNSRIFQNVSTPDIVSEVLRSAGLPEDMLVKRLFSSYEPRGFCVQYQESDLQFISRLLEEEGIFYFFVQDEDTERLVLGDGAYSVEAVPGVPQLDFRDQKKSTGLEDEVVYRFEARAAVRPGRASMRDFRFKKPDLNLEVSKSVGSFGNLEMYYFPGEYTDPSMGQRLAGVRLEELQAERHRFYGQSDCRALLPGHQLQLECHPRPDFNQAYLLLTVEHHGAQAQSQGEWLGTGAAEEEGYRCTFTAQPLSDPFRPARVTPRPIIPGLQSAQVVGEPGEEIYCDEYGRIKVSFHWDRSPHRDQRSSCWIRVNQPWAGPEGGGIFIPRVGQEVLIQFLEGDPDRPVVIGRLFNANNPSPYKLPEHRTRTTIKSASTGGGGGYNELRMEDREGSEEVYLQAEKDWNTLVKNDKNTTVGSNECSDVGGSRSRTVGGEETVSVGASQSVSVGSDQSTSVGASQTISVAASQDTSVGASQSVSVGASQSVSVGSCQSVTVSASQSLSVGADQGISVGAAQTITVAASSCETIGASKQITATSDITLTVGGSSITMTPGSIVLTSPVIVLEAGGLAQVNAPAIKLSGLAVVVDGAATCAISAPATSVMGATVSVIGSTLTLDGSGTASLHGGTLAMSGDGSAALTGGDIEITGGTVKINS